MADDKETFVLDLDTKDFVKKALHAKDTVEGLGDASNLEGLLAGLTKTTMVLGVVGVAAFAVKAAFETVFDAEEIKKVNTQFEQLAGNAGIVASELKEGLVGAAKGLADDTAILGAANKALVEMGGSADKLPEVMELARKATSVFGGDLIDNFDKMSSAIATGNTKMLKHMGIIVDTDKAQKTYAASLGIAASELSEAGKRQAIMNAVLEKGQDAFKGVSENADSAITTWQQLKVTISQVTETFVLAFDKVLGPSVKTFLKSLSGWAGEFKTIINAGFGQGVEQADAKAKVLQDRIQALKATIIDLEQKQMGHVFDPIPGDTNARMKAATAELQKIEAEYAAATGKAKELHAEEQAKGEGAAAAGGGKESAVNTDAQLKNRAAFESEILRLRKERIAEEMKLTESSMVLERGFEAERVNMAAETNAKVLKIQASEQFSAKQKNELIAAEYQNLQLKLAEMDVRALEAKKRLNQEQIQLSDNSTQYESLANERRLLNKQEYEAKIQMIEMNKDLNEQQKQSAKVQQEEMYRMQTLAQEEEFTRQRMAMTDRWVAHGNNAADQWAKGFARGSMQAQQQMANFGAQGTMVMGMFTNHAANAFIELGEGSKKGSDIMRDAVYGMIADVAVYYGTMMLAAGLFPPNPVALAGGAALLVLAGVLKGKMKKGGAGAGFGGGSIGAGGGELGGGMSFQGGESPIGFAQQQQRQSKSVSITVQGNYFETEQTRTKMTDLVREAMDSTDFSIRRVGGGI